MTSRRNFIKISGGITGSFMLTGLITNPCFAQKTGTVKVDAHLWVYASRYPPDWDCTPILDEVFSDLKYAGYDRIELMESIPKHDDSVKRLNELVNKYDLQVTGTSYNGDMWNKDQQQHILEDIELVIERLHIIGGN